MNLSRQDELAVEQPGTSLHPHRESRAQAPGLGRSAAGEMRQAERRGGGHAGTPRYVSRVSRQPGLQPRPGDPPGAIPDRTVPASTSGGPGERAQRDEHRHRR